MMEESNVVDCSQLLCPSKLDCPTSREPLRRDFCSTYAIMVSAGTDV
jgi:hypothetical protein